MSISEWRGCVFLSAAPLLGGTRPAFRWGSSTNRILSLEWLNHAVRDEISESYILAQLLTNDNEFPSAGTAGCTMLQ